MNAPATRRSPGLALAVGLAAVVGGLWLFLDAQGVGVPPFKRLWPVLLILAGAAALYDFFALSRRPRAAGWALAYFGLGILAFAFTLDYTGWRQILDWLPSFPTILGLAFLVSWLAGRRQNDGLLLVGGIFLALGLVGFAARFDWLQHLLPSAQVIWALLLLGGGGWLVWRSLAQAKRDVPPPPP